MKGLAHGAACRRLRAARQRRGDLRARAPRRHRATPTPGTSSRRATNSTSVRSSCVRSQWSDVRVTRASAESRLRDGQRASGCLDRLRRWRWRRLVVARARWAGVAHGSRRTLAAGRVCHQRPERSFCTARRAVAGVRPLQRAVSGGAARRAARRRAVAAADRRVPPVSWLARRGASRRRSRSAIEWAGLAPVSNRRCARSSRRCRSAPRWLCVSCW